MTESRDQRAYLNDIIESCDRIIANLTNTTAETFKDDLNLQDAFARRFEIIGEAVKRLPMELRDQYPNIAWRDATGFRDVIAHDYFDLELDRMFSTAADYIPAFRAQVAAVLADLDRNAST